MIEIPHVAPLADLGYALGGGRRLLKPGRLFVTALAAVREYFQPGTLLPRRRGKEPGTPIQKTTDLARAVDSLLNNAPEEATAPYTRQCLQALWSGEQGRATTGKKSIEEIVRELVKLAEHLGLLKRGPIEPTDVAIALVARHKDLQPILETLEQHGQH